MSYVGPLLPAFDGLRVTARSFHDSNKHRRHAALLFVQQDNRSETYPNRCEYGRASPPPSPPRQKRPSVPKCIRTASLTLRVAQGRPCVFSARRGCTHRRIVVTTYELTLTFLLLRCLLMKHEWEKQRGEVLFVSSKDGRASA